MVTEVKKFVHECKRENPKVEDEKWKLEVVASTDAWRNVLEGLKEEDGQLERKKIQATMNLQTKDKGGYEHYYMNPNEVTTEGVDILLMNKAFHKYQRLMSKLFERFNREEEWTGMVDSLEMMLKILNGATYGSKFVGSTTWFLECFKFTEAVLLDVGHRMQTLLVQFALLRLEKNWATKQRSPFITR